MPLQHALMCLALNIYHEARGEPLDGQIAVAMVTMNRADWQSANVCQVVYERKQFSWTYRAENHTPQEPVAWARAKRVANRVIAGHHEDITYGATHFHTRAVRPAWRHSLKKTTTIGQHVFYVPQ
ncbi:MULTISPECIES: cell wall hydrolase [Pseudomonas]|uniref:Cell wall hydrolase n=1 Tax=Pseudomonas cedrina TaxID=651740 RepID=A0A2S9D5I6_PSECE|nr:MULTISPECIES: cell wall hydrolase [Pseudomonas]AVJ22736.1 cell wall hydrolase [Pseudomonas sp. MYb193]PRB90096.1 cell wall hydrolase [Pseudomonas cedrina]